MPTTDDNQFERQSPADAEGLFALSERLRLEKAQLDKQILELQQKDMAFEHIIDELKRLIARRAANEDMMLRVFELRSEENLEKYHSLFRAAEERSVIAEQAAYDKKISERIALYEEHSLYKKNACLISIVLFIVGSFIVVFFIGRPILISLVAAICIFGLIVCISDARRSFAQTINRRH